MKICAVIPCYNVSDKIIFELKKNYKDLDNFIVVDDCCPNKIGKKISKEFKNKKKIKVIFNKKNIGVGGSVKRGIDYALKLNIDIIVKIDGDCQTKFEDIKNIKNFLIKDFEFVKGNRFLNPKKVFQMPLHRNLGNKIISIIFKLLSNRWDIEDPLNGYIAFNKKLLKKINFNNIADDYFFETNLLFKIAENKIPVKHFSNFVTYRNDILSSFNPLTELFNFSIKMFGYFFQRLSRTYLDLNKINFNSFIVLFLLFIVSKFSYDVVLNFFDTNKIIDYQILKIGLFMFPVFYFIDYFNTKIKKQ